eukprot:TRINITY_DN21755_c0_g1_i1.p1 TRINITY_DN21755_c0_g1~~TRINITY_DN21755_c0_g1_i1.p1  ORF type:complete len:1101 (+),score=375.70 TRINITY_DN21755_c0_g1_i1:76-3378(+)
MSTPPTSDAGPVAGAAEAANGVAPAGSNGVRRQRAASASPGGSPAKRRRTGEGAAAAAGAPAASGSDGGSTLPAAADAPEAATGAADGASSAAAAPAPAGVEVASSAGRAAAAAAGDDGSSSTAGDGTSNPKRTGLFDDSTHARSAVTELDTNLSIIDAASARDAREAASAASVAGDSHAPTASANHAQGPPAGAAAGAQPVEEVKVKLEPAEDKAGVKQEPEQPWGPGTGEGRFRKRPDIAKAFERVARSVWNTEAWGIILKELRGHPFADVDDVYRRFLYHYPTAASVWVQYIHAIQDESESRMDADTKRTRLDEIFAENLLQVQSVPLWRMYTQHVVDKGVLDESARAFKFVCDRLGCDWEADTLYKEHLNFLKRAGIGMHHQQATVREVYQNLLKSPVRNLDEYVKLYERFERELNPARPLKFSDEQRSNVSRAKHHFGDLLRYLSPLDCDHYSRPPEVAAAHPRAQDFEQIALWQRLIDFEAENNMRLSDKNGFHRRVVSTINKALNCTYRHFMQWYTLAMTEFEHNPGSSKEGNLAFSKGMVACPDSLVLRLAYADFIASLSPDAGVQTRVQKRSSPEEPLMTIWQRKGAPPIPCMESEAELGPPGRRKFAHFRPFHLGVAIFEDALQLTAGDQARRTVAWAHYLRFLKLAARTDEELALYSTTLDRAHDDPLTAGGEVYSAALRLERGRAEDAAASMAKQRHMLDMGFARLRDNGNLSPSFVLRYIQFLTENGDSASLRHLFEKLFGQQGIGTQWMDGHPPSAILECYNRLIDFHCWHGDLRKVRWAERLRRGHIGQRQVGTEERELVHRYAVHGLLPVTKEQLAALDRIEAAYWRLADGDDATKAGRTQKRPLTEQTLAGHGNPSRPRRGDTQLRPLDMSRWQPMQQVVAMNPHRWTPADDQNSDLPKQPSNVGRRWDPRKAPQPEMMMAGGGAATGAAARDGGGAAAAAADIKLPSMVRRLISVLPAPSAYNRRAPNAPNIIKIFREQKLPPLKAGRVNAEALERAKEDLRRHRFDPAQLLDEPYVEAIRKKVSRLKEDEDDLARMREGNKLLKSLGVLLQHNKTEISRKRERDREREEQRAKAAAAPRLR